MKAKPWEVPIRAGWHRANELTEVKFGRNGLTLKLVEAETEQTWVMNFSLVQAFKSTTEECAGQVLSILPEKGGFFEIIDSPWLQELGSGRVAFLDDARHYVICCYEEVIEVVGKAYDIERA